MLETLRAKKGWLLALAGLVVLVALATAAAWFIVSLAQTPAERPEAKTTENLTATPEDIEAHGSEALSVLAPDDARTKNAATAFATGRPEPAKAFAFSGSAADRSRAVDCLAAAALYEAGNDTTGQAAVAQVVLNRVRHTAFPATVCGVVYQGSARKTGCQFTFTCDGSLNRVMPASAWSRARGVARRALDGTVDATVGWATHYHTDWVYPYWSPSLNKLARVGTHLFFGWPGSWGSAGAFKRAYRGNEVVPGKVASNMPEESLETSGTFEVVDPGGPKILGLPMPRAELPEGMGKVPLYGNRLRLVGRDERSFGLLAPPGAASSKLVNAALALCSKSGPCTVNAWANEDDIPGQFPIPQGARTTMVFEYLRGSGSGKGSVAFDCALYPNKDPARCLSPRLDPSEILSGARFKE